MLLVRSTPCARTTTLPAPGWRALFDALTTPTRLSPPTSLPTPPPARPGTTGWLGWLSYDLGRVIEPAAGARRTRPVPHDRARNARSADEHGWPLATFVRAAAGWLVPHAGGPWLPVGDPGPPPAPAVPTAWRFSDAADTGDAARSAYTRAVHRALGLIAAGDCYQVNLAHRLRRTLSGTPRAFFADAASAADPLLGALVESPGLAVCSLSPELFVSLDPAARTVRTRPMKGTRPISADPAELRDAPKDRAELDMIVDLMRNDLGRVAALGSVRVTHPRVIERHGSGVWQATATVEATLRDGLGPADLIEAAFPPGSVTGAPKIRAMQIIDRLEPAPRGPYCGAIGWLGDDGSAELAVAIRTAAMARQTEERWTLDYWAGAGIVADSTPDGEWAETLVKAGPVLAASNEPRP